jgi:hypothetical protein
MDDTEVWLRGVCNTAAGPYLRPFAPNSRWREPELLVVGTNPATSLRYQFASFEEYWRGLTREPHVFYRQYCAVHRGGETKSTARTRRFLEQLQPLNVLVTNAYAYPAEQEKLIPDKPRQLLVGREIFSRLSAPPTVRVAIFHGARAFELANLVADRSVDAYVPLLEQTAQARGANPFRIYLYPHFSGRGVRKGFPVGQMDADLGRLARRLKSELGAV